MTNKLIILFLIVSSFSLGAQNIKNDTIINLDKLTKDKIYSIQNNGWALVSYNNKISLGNFSNKDYMLYFPINCKNEAQKPSFLIEFSNNYRDGHRGGLDFTSSRSDNFVKIIFLIDERAYGNPFKNYAETTFESFKDALKKGKTLTIKFFNNPDNGEKELKLNRTIDFMLANSQLLDVQVDCKE